MASLKFPAATLGTTQRRSIAEQWLASAQWSVFNMRASRATAEQSGVAHTTVRVFSKGCPPHCLRDVLQILGERAPEVNPVFDASTLTGSWWHKAAWWVRDDRGARGGDSTITIFRELSDGQVSVVNVVEDGCGSRTTIRYVWDAAEIEDISDVTDAGSQGFSVRIGGLDRDPATGIYKYYVATTERLTQYVPEYISGEDVFFTESDATWLGLRGDPSAPTDDEGAPVTPWDPATQAIGEQISAQWARNIEDCTLTAQGKKKVAKQSVLSSKGSAKDMFKVTASEGISAAPEALGVAPVPVGGITVVHKDVLRPDGLWNTDKVEETAVPEANAVLIKTQTKFSKEEIDIDRNVSVAVSALVAVAGGVVTERKTELNPDGTFNNTESVKTAISAPDSVLAKTQTKFSKEETDVDRNASTAVADLVTVTDGVITERRAEMNPDGTWNNSNSVKTAVAAPNAVIVKSQTAFGKEETDTDRNASTAVSALVEVAGGVVTERRAEMNADGTYNNTESVKTAIAVPSAILAKTQNKFGKEETDVDRNASAAVSALVKVADGVITERRAEMNPDGTYNNTENIKTAIAAPNAVLVKTQTKFSKEETGIDRNASAAVSALVEVADGVITERRAEMNPDGTYNNTENIKTAIFAPAATKEFARTMFGTEESVVNRNAGELSTMPVDTVVSGVLEKHRSDMNPDGTWNNTSSVNTAITVMDALRVKVQTKFEIDETSIDRNAPTAVIALADVAGGVVTERRAEMNPDGTYNNTEAIKTAVAATDVVISKTQNVFGREESTVDRNVAEPVSDLVEVAGGAITERKAEMNSDGTFNNTEAIKTEIAVDEASVTTKYSPRGSVTTTTQRSQETKAPNFVAGEYGTLVNELTPAGRYNTAVEKTSLSINSGVVLSRERFGTVDDDTEITVTQEGTEPVFGVTGLSNAGKAGASITRERHDLQDDGSYIKTVTVSTARPKTYVEHYETYLDVSTDTQHENMSLYIYHYSYGNMPVSELMTLLSQYNYRPGSEMTHSYNMNKYGLFSGVLSYKNLN
jgi:hypothetical protein